MGNKSQVPLKKRPVSERVESDTSKLDQSSDFPFPKVNKEQLEQVQPLKIQCKKHKKDAEFVCLFRNCVESFGVCHECKSLHKHEGKETLMTKDEFNLKMAERIASYKLYTEELQLRMDNIYEDILTNLSNVITFVKKDEQQMNDLLNTSENYEDNTFKLLQGQIDDVERLQIWRFILVQPKKICDTRFQLFNAKLAKRKAQFTTGINQIVVQTEKLKTMHKQKTLYEEKQVSKVKETLTIVEPKWNTIYDRLAELKEQPIHLQLVSNGNNYVKCVNFIIQNSNLSLRKFADLLKDSKFYSLQSLKLYSSWYIDDIAEYRILARALNSLPKLTEVTIITRHPLKSIAAFSNLRKKIKLFSQEWEEANFEKK